MICFSGRHYPRKIILQCVRWYVSYGISYRDLEEMMSERGFEIDHSTLNRWVVNYAAQIEQNSRKYKRPIDRSWRMDETYVRIKGKWRYLYRAVDKYGQTIDFMLTARRDKAAAFRFFRKALFNNRLPLKINIDKSGSNTAAIEIFNRRISDPKLKIEIRQNKYLNNIVEQDHRHIKRVINPMMGFKKFSSATATIAGIELVNMIKKGQFEFNGIKNLTKAEQFYRMVA